MLAKHKGPQFVRFTGILSILHLVDYVGLTLLVLKRQTEEFSNVLRTEKNDTQPLHSNYFSYKGTALPKCNAPGNALKIQIGTNH